MATPAYERLLEECLEEDSSPILHRLRRIQQAKHASTSSGGGQSSFSSEERASNAEYPLPVDSKLSWKQNRLTWTCGSVTIRTFSFTEDIIDATWAWFPFPKAHPKPQTSPRAKGKEKADQLCRALCALFKHKLHVVFISSGDTFDVPLAFHAAAIFTATQGVFVQRHLEAKDHRISQFNSDDAAALAEQERLPTVFHLNRILQDVGGVYRADELSWNTSGEAQLRGALPPFADLEETLIFVSKRNDANSCPVLVTRSAHTKTLRIYAYAVGEKEPVILPSRTSSANLPASLRFTAAKDPKADIQEDHNEGDLPNVADSTVEPFGDRYVRQPPRKSARLEHDRRKKYYGPLAANDAMDRSRRISMVGAVSRRANAVDDGPPAQVELDTTAGLPDFTNELARHTQEDAVMEDSIMGVPVRPSLGRRQSSARGRTPSRSAAMSRSRSSRISSAASRQSIPPGKHNGLSLALESDLPQHVLPLSSLGAVPGMLAAADEMDDLESLGRSWAHVAMIGEVAVEGEMHQ